MRGRVGVVLLLAACCGASAPARAQVDSLRVIVPNGAERWRIGSAQEIRWASDGLDSVSIYYRPNAFADLVPIAENTPDDGSHLWTIPDDPTATARVWIFEPDGSDFDVSDFDLLLLPERGASASLWLSSQPDAVVGTAAAATFELFDLWILTGASFDPGFAGVGDGMLAWETSLDLPPGLIVTQVDLFPPGALNLGQNNADFRVGLGACFPDGLPPTAVAHLRLLPTADLANEWIALGPASVSSFDPPTPGWLSCVQPRELLPTESAEGLLFNPVGVSSPGAGPGGLVAVQPNPSAGLSRLFFGPKVRAGSPLRILDLRGRVVRQLRVATEGPTVWDGRDEAGRRVAAGVYTVQSRIGSVEPARVVRLR